MKNQIKKAPTKHPVSNQTASSGRRGFLKTVGAAGVAITNPYIWTSSVARAESANDKIRVASIGTSIYTDRYTGKGDHAGRGAVIGHQAGEIGEMVAVADVNRNAAEFFAERYKGKCEMYKDYEEVLARKDIDAVTIGTPDHWHAKIAIDAMRAGKHVYCEKPLTLTIHEGRQICKVAEETGMVFQTGTQQRSEFQQIFLKAIAIAQSGMLGDKLHCDISIGTAEKGGPFETGKAPDHLDWDKWQGQTPAVDYCERRCDFDFRWWLEYSGGQVTDWGCHHGDIALLAMGQGNSGPTKIDGKGNFPKVENGFNVAYDFDCAYEFNGGHTARLYSGKNELIISGDRGKIRVNRGGLTGKAAEELGLDLKIGADDWGTGKTPVDDKKRPQTPEWVGQAIDRLCHGKKPGSHMGNFFDCVKNGGMPISDVWSSHRSASLCHLANISMRLGRALQWDPVTESFPEDAEAMAMTRREQRKSFEIDVTV
jgi:myo-inositol 2-dehydrogenase / D-chiro-inositol 1-dehydrogenase